MNKMQSTDKIHFTKMQAVGNDFILIDATDTGGLNWVQLAKKLCNRHFGIGSDGLLVIERGTSEALRMRMWNPDGTEDFCGNGLRCAAKYAFENGIVTQTSFGIETNEQVVHVALSVSDNKVESASLEIGNPDIDPFNHGNYSIKIDENTFDLTVIGTGTPHAVNFVDKLPDDQTFFQYSPLLEAHSAFPEKMNVLWVGIKSRTNLIMRIWERGVGETLGCGTGACAAAVAANLGGKTEDVVEVNSAGGVVSVQWRPGDMMRLIGDSQVVYSGYFKNPVP